MACFHIDGAAQQKKVFCSSERIKEIERRSVVLKQWIKDHGNRERIPLEIDDATDINFDALRYLVENLPLDPKKDPGPIKLDDLSRHCSAFWKYQWIPESASILWKYRDQSGLDTQSQCGTSPWRCWRQQTTPQSLESSLYLINIAIVFGLDEFLREGMNRVLSQQIQTAVWNSNPGTQLKTSVEFLRNIEGMRLEELETVFTHFFYQLVHLDKNHPRNARQVRKDLETGMGVDFYESWSENVKKGGLLTTLSVYGFVGRLEDILLGSHERQARESSPHGSKGSDAPHKPKDMPPKADWAAAGGAVAKGAISAGKRLVSYLSNSHESYEPEWSSELQKMFEGTHDRIQKRQEALAGKLIGLRNAESERWKKALQDGSETD